MAALGFADTLATRPHELGPAAWSVLREAFAPPEQVEVVAFCAWQYGGPRMLRSWRSEDYKRGERPELASLPVRLAYANLPEAPSWPAREYPPPTAILARAEALGSPPLAWVRFLAPRPDLLADWTHLYWTSVHSEILGPRVGQLVRAYMSQLLDCPAWAPPDSAALQIVGLTPVDLDALTQGQFSGLSLKEQAALAYAREVVADSDVPDAVYQQVAAALTEPEIVTLGFAVAVQNGTIRVYRSMMESDHYLDCASAASR